MGYMDNLDEGPPFLYFISNHLVLCFLVHCAITALLCYLVTCFTFFLRLQSLSLGSIQHKTQKEKDQTYMQTAELHPIMEKGLIILLLSHRVNRCTFRKGEEKASWQPVDLPCAPRRPSHTTSHVPATFPSPPE